MDKDRRREKSLEEDPLAYALEEIRYFKRAIDGEPRESIPGLKRQVAVIEEKIEQAREEREHLAARKEAQQEQLRLVWKVLGFIGTGGIVGFITWLINLIQSAGGH